MFKKLALASLVFMFLGMVLVALSSKDPQYKINPQAIVRLHDSATGQFFCSGTIINDTQILTAAHCLINGMSLRQVVQVRVVAEKPIRKRATIQSFSIQNDIATLTGNFADLPKLKMEKDATKLIDMWSNPARQIIACGYPYGAALTCIPVTNRSMYWFLWKGQGRLYPGMSGGPVIDLETAQVVASNTAVTIDSVILSPVIGIEQILQILIK